MIYINFNIKTVIKLTSVLYSKHPTVFISTVIAVKDNADRSVSALNVLHITVFYIETHTGDGSINGGRESLLQDVFGREALNRLLERVRGIHPRCARRRRRGRHGILIAKILQPEG